MTATTEANKEAVIRLIEAFNEGNWDTGRELLGEDFDSNFGHDGPGEWIEANRHWQEALDVEYTIEQVLGEGDEVAIRLTASGTHTGAFAGIEPTGNEFEIGMIAIFTLEDGEIVEQHATEDMFELFLQIDAIESPMSS